jgi:hypothetical protein
MALSRHSCHDSDGTYCGSCTGAYLDASCCNQLVETYTPASHNALPRTRCKGNKLGNNVEISVLTGADGSKSVDNVQTSMAETMIGVLALTLVMGITWVATGVMK